MCGKLAQTSLRADINMSWTKFLALSSAVLLFSQARGLNVTLDNGAIYLGDQLDQQDRPDGFGKLMQTNGDIYELLFL